MKDGVAINVHFNQLLKIYRQLPWATKMTADEFMVVLENSVVGLVTGTDGEEIVGFIRGITDNKTVIYICDLWVAEGSRGMGIGKWLIGSVNKLMEETGVTAVVLTGEAKGFYQKHGFEERAGCMIRRANA